MGKKVKISLVVEASALYGIESPTPTQVDSLTFLSDDNGGKSSNGTNEEFESLVYIDSDVKWIGDTMFPKAADKDYKISIDSIVYEQKDGDKDFFDKSTIDANGDNKTTVTAKTKNDTTLEGQEDTYKINFSIHPPNKATGNPKSFSIDPKLKMLPPEGISY